MVFVGAAVHCPVKPSQAGKIEWNRFRRDRVPVKVADCGDACAADPAKLAPGQCGCGNSDIDSDADTIADCLDQCPANDDRIDANANQIPDCLESTAIPIAFTWGLVVIALLLAITAKLVWTRFNPGLR